MRIGERGTLRQWTYQAEKRFSIGMLSSPPQRIFRRQPKTWAIPDLVEGTLVHDD